MVTVSFSFVPDGLFFFASFPMENIHDASYFVSFSFKRCNYFLTKHTFKKSNIAMQRYKTRKKLIQRKKSPNRKCLNIWPKKMQTILSIRIAYYKVVLYITYKILFYSVTESSSSNSNLTRPELLNSVLYFEGNKNFYQFRLRLTLRPNQKHSETTHWSAVHLQYNEIFT